MAMVFYIFINAYLVTALIHFIALMAKPPIMRPRHHPIFVALAWPMQLTFGNIIPLFWFLGATFVGYLVIS